MSNLLGVSRLRYESVFSLRNMIVLPWGLERVEIWIVMRTDFGKFVQPRLQCAFIERFLKTNRNNSKLVTYFST